MDLPSPTMRDLAGRLLAADQADPDPLVHEAVQLSDKLRTSLTRFAGVDGFTSLLRRALALAAAEVPSLKRVKVSVDGRLEGLEQLAVGRDNRAGSEASVAITAHFLDLLVTFVGEPFTLKLVREAWPDTPLDEWNSRAEAD